MVEFLKRHLWVVFLVHQLVIFILAVSFLTLGRKITGRTIHGGIDPVGAIDGVALVALSVGVIVMTRILYKSITPQDYELVRLFLVEAGWQHRVSNPELFRRMIEKTERTVVAWDDSRIVGFARALCDGVSNGYISLVAVAADRRGDGIGRKLVERLIDDDSNITWVLRAGRGSEGFWAKMGFTRSGIAMERPRSPVQEE